MIKRNPHYRPNLARDFDFEDHKVDESEMLWNVDVSGHIIVGFNLILLGPCKASLAYYDGKVDENVTRTCMKVIYTRDYLWRKMQEHQRLFYNFQFS